MKRKEAWTKLNDNKQITGHAAQKKGKFIKLHHKFIYPNHIQCNNIKTIYIEVSIYCEHSLNQKGLFSQLGRVLFCGIFGGKGNRRAFRGVEKDLNNCWFLVTFRVSLNFSLENFLKLSSRLHITWLKPFLVLRAGFLFVALVFLRFFKMKGVVSIKYIYI